PASYSGSIAYMFFLFMVAPTTEFYTLSLHDALPIYNIPGKFLSYMQAGLPVLAAVNAGNDIVTLIGDEGVGRTSTDGSVEALAEDRKSTRLNSSHVKISYAVFCLKKKTSLKTIIIRG